MTRINVFATGLNKKAKHGIYVHEFGDVSDTKAGLLTGGHYTNPLGIDTQACIPKGNLRNRHWGDIGKIYTDKNGKG